MVQDLASDLGLRDEGYDRHPASAFRASEHVVVGLNVDLGKGDGVLEGGLDGGFDAKVTNETDAQSVLGFDDLVGVDGGLTTVVGVVGCERIIVGARIRKVNVGGNDARNATVRLTDIECIDEVRQPEVEVVIAEGGHVVTEVLHEPPLERRGVAHDLGQGPHRVVTGADGHRGDVRRLGLVPELGQEGRPTGHASVDRARAGGRWRGTIPSIFRSIHSGSISDLGSQRPNGHGKTQQRVVVELEAEMRTRKSG